MHTLIKSSVKQLGMVPLFDEKAADDSTPVAYWFAWTLDDKTRAQFVAEGATLDDYDLASDPSFPQRKLKEWGLRTARPRM